MSPNVTVTRSEICGPDAERERERLAKILDEYLLGLERGEPVDPSELLARHPEMAERLRGYLSGLALFHQAASPSWPAAISGGPDLGAVLGDFRLLREIGRGGMGVVYEAVQISLGRRVAVKLLPFTGPINDKQIARFKHEAQAAAQIDHPNIVPVFAIGQERGIHYFAMQLIGGQSLSGLITEMRDEPPHGAQGTGNVSQAADTLDHVMAVARMGVQAAEALGAAHEIGVVHRDIKPSNLLLDDKGKVWITDFGVARCRTESCLTETGYVVGSMPYMSPEQAMGQSAMVDHRSDIYSLGITLYELATLRHPCEGAAHAETAIEFSRSEWRRPRCWNNSIPLDFESIILKAMSESRDDRYATSQEMATDLQRFLEGKPILARPPSLGSRLEKWARRHQRMVAAAATTLAVCMLGLVVGLVMIGTERNARNAALKTATENNLRADQNYQRAEAKFRQAHEVLNRFGVRVNQLLANNVPGAEKVRRELLADMLPYYREFAREAAHDPSLQADLALTYSKIGHLSEQIGSQADAEEAYRDARNIFEQLVRSHPKNLEHQRSLALCCNNLGQVLQAAGKTTAAHHELQRALEIQQELAKDQPATADVNAQLATTNSNLGLLSSQTGEKLKAAEYYQAAIRLQESFRQAAPLDEANLNSLAASYNNLSALFLPGRPAFAQKWVERALNLQLTLVRQYPTQRKYQSDLAVSYNNLGALHSRQDKFLEAELCFRDAITIQQRLVNISPLISSFRRELATSYNNLGMAQSNAMSLTEAAASFQSALEIQEELVNSHPRDVALLGGLGGIYNNLGMLLQQRQDLEGANAAYDKAIAAQRQAHYRAPRMAHIRESLSKHYYNQANVLRAMKRPAEAAEVTVARRELWLGDAAKLLKIADDLAEICREIPAGDIHQQYLQEARLTRHEAAKAGAKPRPSTRTRTVDVFYQDEPSVPSAESGESRPPSTKARVE